MVERKGGESLNTEAYSGDHCLVERRGRGSLNKEASWRPLYGGAQGGR